MRLGGALLTEQDPHGQWHPHTTGSGSRPGTPASQAGFPNRVLTPLPQEALAATLRAR